MPGWKLEDLEDLHQKTGLFKMLRARAGIFRGPHDLPPELVQLHDMLTGGVYLGERSIKYSLRSENANL